MWDPYAEFKTATLSNGLTIHAMQWPNALWQRVGFLVHVGAKEDPVGLEGLSHYLEHMVSKNAKTPFEEIREFFKECAGTADFGATSHFYTMYDFKVPAEDHFLAQALQYYGEMLLEAQITNFLERERGVILSEYSRMFPSADAFERTLRPQRMLFKGYWVERMAVPLGDSASIRKIALADLQKHYAAYYTPANISIVSVGALPLDKVVRQLEKSPFAAKKKGSRNPVPAKVGSFDVPLECMHIISASEYTTQKINSGNYYSRSAMPETFSSPAVTLTADLIEDQLHKEIREKRAWAYGSNLTISNFGHFRKVTIDCRGVPKEALPLIDGIVQECIAAVGTDRGLFEKIKRRALLQTKLRESVSNKVLNQAMEELSRFGRIITLEEYGAETTKVQFEDIQKVLEYFRTERRFRTIYHP